jgi:hypothetical protein
MNSVRLTRNKLACIAILAVAPLVIGAVTYLHFFRIPKLSTSGARLRLPETLVFADRGPQNLPCASRDDEPSQPIETTVCAVVQHPDWFACKRIRFRATLRTDCLEHAALVGDGCERGILPTGPPNPSPAVDAFFDSACVRPINFDVRRTARFAGRFRLRLRDQRTICVLEIESLEDVRVALPPRIKAGLKPD